MVKQKKVSKSAIAIVVLALLLVLSMVMGLTGAWFSDRKSNEAHNDTLNLGVVKITPAAGAVTAAAATTRGQLLPGDVFSVAQSSMTNSGDVNEYVYYKFDISISVSGAAYDGSAWGAESSREIKDAVKSVSADSTVDANRVFAYSAAGIDGLCGMKILQASAVHNIATFTVTFTTAVPGAESDDGNFIYVGATRYVINKGNSYSPLKDDIDISNKDVTLSVTLHTYALQEDNVSYEALGAWLTAISADATTKAAVNSADKLTSWKSSNLVSAGS